MAPGDSERLIASSDPPVATPSDWSLSDERLVTLGRFLGRCLVCGAFSTFVVEHPNLRETCRCQNCGSYNRQRQLVYVLARELSDHPLTLIELAARLEGRALLTLEANGSMYLALRHLAPVHGIHLVATEYLGPGLASGQVLSGVVHLDVERSGLPDASFDVILHADVFEHVGDVERAEREVVRMLKPGGVCVFTVPFGRELADDDVRAVVSEGVVEHLKEPWYHSDPLAPGGRCLVFRIFSLRGLESRFAALGQNFRAYHVRSERYGIVGADGYVFVVRKPAPAATP